MKVYLDPFDGKIKVAPTGGGDAVESRYEIFEDEEIEVTQGRNMLLVGSYYNGGAVMNNGVIAWVKQE